MNPDNTEKVSSYSRTTQRTDMDDLVAQIDAYLAKQLESKPRPTSSGTMFVDFDHHGSMQISYRNRREMHIEGYDFATHYQYDYDGSIMHLHRESSRPSSCCSEYYTLDAERYSPLRPFVSLGDGDVLSGVGRKRRRAREFIQGLLRRIEGSGLMRKFREERVRARQEARMKGRGCHRMG
jgi:hypothetical protein